MSKNKSLKKKAKTHNMRKILPFYAKSKWLLVMLFMCFLVGGVLGIFGPIYSANALASFAQLDFEKTKRFAILTLIVSIVRVIVFYFNERLYVKINSNTKFELTKTIMQSINQTKMSKLDSVKLGALSERLSSDVNAVSDAYLDMMNLVFDILTNLVFFGYIAYLNFYLFLILLVYVVILYVVCLMRSKMWIHGKKIVKKANEEAKSMYYQQITGIRDVKLLNMKDNLTDFANKKYEDALNQEKNLRNKRNLYRRIQRLLAVTFELIFLLVGIVFIKKELILLSGFLVIYNYYGKVDGLVNFLSSFSEYNAEGEISASRIFEVVEDFEKESFGNESLENFSGNVSFKNVNYAYSNGVQVLKNVNLKFEPGKMTAIVGKSGSGKTTILNLISKLYDVSDDSIFFDEKDINSLSENAIRSNIGEISQSPYIFNSSIRQNLLFAKPDASEDEMIEVLKRAQIYDDIKKMQDGLDTEIGENGVKISGGQRQRLAIARLLLKDNKVIVFDEATSALDNGSQSKIASLLENMKKDKTVIIVAHRLSTIINADKIYMIDDGSVIAEGTHSELMKNCEKYKKLYELEESGAKIS